MDSVKSAQSMLDEILSEPLQKLLTSVAYETSPPGSTHISGLDAHFFSTVSHHSSSKSSLNRGDVIEIQGPASSGKSHLLYHLIITCIIPTTHSSVSLGGWDKAAVVFDDGAFNIRRLHELLLSRLRRFLVPNLTSAAIGQLATELLAKVHIFRPTSSAQLATTLLHLPAYHATQIPNFEIGLLAIDSISAFYWPDRFKVEQMRSASDHSFVSPLHHVLIALQKFRLSHGPVTVLVNWGLNPLVKDSTSSAPPTFYRQHLHPFPSPLPPRSTQPQPAPSSNIAGSSGSIYSSAVNIPPLTHHITLSSTSITPFSPGISLVNAREDEKKYRSEVVERGEIVGLVRTTGSSLVGRFVFWIRDQEVLVGETTQTQKNK